MASSAWGQRPEMSVCWECCGSSLLAGGLTSLAPCSAAPSAQPCCWASPESFLHLFWAGVLGTASQSCDDDIKSRGSSFVIPWSPWGQAHPCAEGQHAKLHHFSHAGALGKQPKISCLWSLAPMLFRWGLGQTAFRPLSCSRGPSGMGKTDYWSHHFAAGISTALFSNIESF